jgi:hypothetical protein
MKNERVLLGRCGVDSGQIMLVDPCYVLDHQPDGNRDEYFAVCGAHDVKCDCTTHEYEDWHKGIGGETAQGGVVVGRFGGDGCFPVYANIVQGEVQSVEIVFSNQEDSDE